MTWLAGIDDGVRLPELVIPGTHDAATGKCDHPYYKTQTLTLEEQLQVGVRFFDLRLRKTMQAAHREWEADFGAPEIFATIHDFLERNPSEFLVLRIQNANEAKDDFASYAAALHDFLRPHLDLFYRGADANSVVQGGRTWPTVGQLRSRVLAFECAPAQFEAPTIDGERWAADWHDNPAVVIQDLWDGPSVEAKQQAISEHLHLPGDQLVLNHISATNGALGNPLPYAQQLNPYLLEQLDQTARGILIADFMDEGLASAMIAANRA